MCAKTHRPGREQCLTASKVTGHTGSRDAPSVRASLVSSDITRGERRFAQGGASIASRLAVKATAIGWAGSGSASTNHSKRMRGHDDAPDLTTRQRIFEDGADFAPHR